VAQWTVAGICNKVIIAVETSMDEIDAEGKPIAQYASA
jgi:hypothetical protein